MPKKVKAKSPRDTALVDLQTLKDTVEELEDALEREDFDEFDAGDAWSSCIQIEELAQAIKEAVKK